MAKSSSLDDHHSGYITKLLKKNQLKKRKQTSGVQFI
jgi:ribosomal protein S17E